MLLGVGGKGGSERSAAAAKLPVGVQPQQCPTGTSAGLCYLSALSHSTSLCMFSYCFTECSQWCQPKAEVPVPIPIVLFMLVCRWLQFQSDLTRFCLKLFQDENLPLTSGTWKVSNHRIQILPQPLNAFGVQQLSVLLKLVLASPPPHSDFTSSCNRFEFSAYCCHNSHLINTCREV